MLGSGSRGNAVLLESGGQRLLVDAGFGVRTLQERLRAIGVAPQSIGVCVITHEHADHVKGAAQAAARWGWALHASAGTVAATPALASATPFAAGETLRLEGFTVETARTPHDARESVAVVATATRTGARAGICTDLGHATDGVRALLRDVELLVLEANHDGGMLRAGPYPASVCDRIGGRFGHLSNDASAALARTVAGPAVRQLVLAHLSEHCNTPQLALGAVHAALARSRFRGAIDVAMQDAIAGPFAAPCAARPVVVAQQLALGF
jgi:phosphoribosyl 1,2-cyclic phosphodiesterase